MSTLVNLRCLEPTCHPSAGSQTQGCPEHTHPLADWQLWVPQEALPQQARLQVTEGDETYHQPLPPQAPEHTHGLPAYTFTLYTHHVHTRVEEARG